MNRHVLAAVLCALLWTERFPIDDIASVEVRALLCTRLKEPHVIVKTRTYERIQQPDGTYRYRQAGSEGDWEAVKSEAWWTEVNDVRLYVTTYPAHLDEPTASPAEPGP